MPWLDLGLVTCHLLSPWALYGAHRGHLSPKARRQARQSGEARPSQAVGGSTWSLSRNRSRLLRYSVGPIPPRDVPRHSHSRSNHVFADSESVKLERPGETFNPANSCSRRDSVTNCTPQFLLPWLSYPNC